MAKVANEYLPLSVLGEFPNDWTEATLSQVCVQVTDGTHDSPKPQSIGGFPLVTGKAIKDRNIDFSVTYNISEDNHKKVIERSKAERDDILFANIGNSIGDLVRVQTDKEFSIKNVALFKPDLKVIQPRFLEYFLLSEIVQNFIRGSTRGSAQPFIGLGSLRGFPIALPPMHEQINIGSILGALDDRITVLRETNATLEAIAQAMFKSWFVDFDPVRAKQQGIAPEGMDAATAALFPDSFEESELSLVPRGWRVDSIYAAAKLIYGAPFASSKFNTVSLGKPLIRIRDLKDEAPGVFTQEVHPKGYLVKPGDIVVGMDGEFRAYLWGGDEAWLNQRVCVFVPLDGFPTTFIHRIIMPILAAVEASETATTVIHLGKNDIDRFRIAIPGEPVLRRFGQITDSIYKKIIEQKQTTRTLSALRDTLLPRLISGQLRLPEAAALLEQVTA